MQPKTFTFKESLEQEHDEDCEGRSVGLCARTASATVSERQKAISEMRNMFMSIKL